MSQTSYQQFLRQLKSIGQTGFSLVEMMIVMVIAGFFIAYGANKLGSRSSQVKSSVRQFYVIAKKLRNRARVDNKTYRLVFDLPLDKKKEQGYWVESTDKVALLLNEEQREEMLKDLEEQETKSGKKEKPDPQGFVTDSKVIKSPPATLPRDLFFESIELDGDPIQTTQQGRVYIYFFPQGYVQRSAIHITDREKQNWTISIEGINGRVKILPKFISLADLKEQ